MKWWKYALATTLAIAAATTVSEPLSARPQPVVREIRIMTRVLPMHTIIINQQGDIREIISNTTDDVQAPRVYLNKPSKDSERQMTPEIYAEYRQHVRKGEGKVGVLYTRAGLLANLKEPRDRRASNPYLLLDVTGEVTHQSSPVSVSRM